MYTEARFRKAVIALHRYCEDHAELDSAEVSVLVAVVCAERDVLLNECGIQAIETLLSETAHKWDVWP